MKTAQGALDNANKKVPKICVQGAIENHGSEDVIFIDVRDGLDIVATGTIKGALRIPRGFIEFAADPNTPFHHKSLDREKNIYLVCAAGGMAALTGETLIDMGYSKVFNVGGFSDWKEAGGPVED